MPATIANLIGTQLEARVKALGAQMRQRRKVMDVSVTTAAEAAGISRVTWHRMEKGVVTVTVGAWFNALAVLGLEFGVGLTGQVTQAKASRDSQAAIPLSVAFADFPQLAALAWQVHGVASISPREAFDIYERNERHINREELTDHEENLITNLTTVFGEPGGL